MLNKFKIIIALLLMVTILWAALFYQSVIEFMLFHRELSYQAWNKGQIMLLGELALLCLWMVIAITRRNILIGVAVLGIIMAPAFFFSAGIEDVGYAVEYVSTIGKGTMFQITLNPLLHLGGGVYESYRDPSLISINSSMRIENLLLYLFYGELTSFSFFGIYVGLRKLYRYTYAHLKIRNSTTSRYVKTHQQ